MTPANPVPEPLRTYIAPKPYRLEHVLGAGANTSTLPDSLAAQALKRALWSALAALAISAIAAGIMAHFGWL